MKKLFIALMFLPLLSRAQLFIDKALVEYEVKTNLKKTLGTGPMAERMINMLPQYKIGYFNYVFEGNKSIYKFSRWQENIKIPDFLRKSDEDNSWYFDHTIDSFNMKKNVFGTDFNIFDSIQHIKWKLLNENRVIAGFNCRKAVGIIMDSVYVFAFYTDEITISGGPCSLHGLPGLILGATIPRIYTSYIATKVQVNDVNTAKIQPVTGKKTYTIQSLRKTMNEKMGDWGSKDEESKNFMDQFFWNTLL